MTQDILAAIEKTIFPGYRCPLVRDSIVLVEESKDAVCKKVTFLEAVNVLVYKFDQLIDDADGKPIKEPFLFLSKESPIRSKCDYLIFHARENSKGQPKLYIFVCNLKSDQAGNLIDQFNSGSIFGEFLVQTAIRCLNSWSSSKKGFDALDYRMLLKEKMIEVKGVAIGTKKYPIQKGYNVPGPQSTMKQLNCNEVHNFMTLLC
jgi:hypothetical protein